jgi:hypothetical protein
VIDSPQRTIVGRCDVKAASKALGVHDLAIRADVVKPFEAFARLIEFIVGVRNQIGVVL